MGTLVLHCREEPFGTTAVHQRVAGYILEKGRQVEKAPLVLWPDGDLLGVPLGELVGEGHRRLRAASVEQGPVAAYPLDFLEHRENRCDADTARDEAVLRRVDQCKVVARAADPHCGSLREVVVHILR